MASTEPVAKFPVVAATGALPSVDDAAFRAWYEASLPRVYGYLFSRCGRSADIAEELTQQTFVEAVRSRVAQPSIGWLIGIARHRLLDHFRGRERRERRFLQLVANREPQNIWRDDADPTGRIFNALDHLPAAQRAAVVLCYVDELPVREAARLLGRTESAVESLLGRARATLRLSVSEESR